jgi:DNA primase
MRRLPVGAATRIGLLRHAGHELLAGRLVVPEIRSGQPIWLIGRTIGPHFDGPKYLGLPGHKPLLGWDGVKGSPEVILVEGVFDWLTLVSWGYPALALVGTHAYPRVLKALARFEHVTLLLDGDEAGQTAAKNLVRTLGQRATTVTLPGVKDVSELATIPNGRQILADAIEDKSLAVAA